MLKFFKNNWAAILSVVLCFWAAKALLVPGFFSIHDDEQIARLFQLDTVLREGQIPARWVPDLGFGFGYPFFNFYPPFAYYLGEVFHLLGLSFIDSTKLVILLGFFGAAFFMYLWVKNHFGKMAGIFSALLYTYSSYHAVDVYVRGDIPEFLSFVWIPAVLWSTDLLFKAGKIKYFFGLCAFLSLVVLTHSLIAFPFIFFFVAYAVFLLLQNRKNFNRNFLLVFVSASLAFCLSMFFWLPVFLEKKFTLVDGILTAELASYELHFVYIRQLWDSVWGYGGSIFGLYDGISFEVGKLQLIVSLTTVILVLFIFLKKKTFDRDFRLPFFIFALLIFSLFMTTFYSQAIWDRIQPLSYLQFPWRFLIFVAAFSSFLGGFFIGLIEKITIKPLSVLTVFILSIILISSASSRFQPSKHLLVTDLHYTDRYDITWRVSKMSFEFVPKGIATKLSDIKTTQVDLGENDIPKNPYTILDGKAEVEVISNKSHSKVFKIKSQDKSTIQINTFSFPGWRTFLDSKELGYSDNNKLKLITVSIPAGIHKLEVNFTNTLPRAVGNAITLITLFNLIGFGLFKLWKR